MAMFIHLHRAKWFGPLAYLLALLFLGLPGGLVPAAAAALPAADQGSALAPYTSTLVKAHSGTGPFHVSLILDLHCQFEVQCNIAKTIAALQQQRRAALIGLEGSSGSIQAPGLKNFQDENLKTQTLLHGMQQGLISGAEYAYLQDKSNELRLVGIENQALYQDALRLIPDFINRDARRVLDKFSQALEKIQDRCYQAPLARLSGIEKQKTTLGRQAYVHALAKLGADFRMNMAAYPVLASSRGQVSLPGADGAAQIEHFRQDFIQRQAHTLDEQKVVYFSEKFGSFERLLGLTAQSQDWQNWLDQKDKYERPAIEKFFQNADLQLRQKTGLEPADFDALFGYLRAAREFYSLLRQREQAMVQNYLACLQAQHVQEGILVAGGFHRAGLEKLLAAANVSYTVIMPYRPELEIENHYPEYLQEKIQSLVSTSRSAAQTAIAPESILAGADAPTTAGLAALSAQLQPGNALALAGTTITRINVLHGDQTALEVQYTDNAGQQRQIIVTSPDMAINSAAVAQEIKTLTPGANVAAHVLASRASARQGALLSSRPIQTHRTVLKIISVLSYSGALLALVGSLAAAQYLNANTMASFMQIFGPSVMLSLVMVFVGVGNQMVNTALGSEEQQSSRQVAAFSAGFGLNFNETYMQQLLKDEAVLHAVIEHEMLHARMEMGLIGFLRNTLGMNVVADMLHKVSEVVAYGYCYGIALTFNKLFHPTARSARQYHTFNLEAMDPIMAHQAYWLQFHPQGDRWLNALQAYALRQLGFRADLAGTRTLSLAAVPSLGLLKNPNTLFMRIATVFTAMATSTSTQDVIAEMQGQNLDCSLEQATANLQANALRQCGVSTNRQGIYAYPQLSNLLDSLFSSHGSEMLQALRLLAGMSLPEFRQCLQLLDPALNVTDAQLSVIKAQVNTTVEEIGQVYSRQQWLQSVSDSINMIAPDAGQTQEVPQISVFPTIVDLTQLPADNLLAELQGRLASARSQHVVVAVTAEQSASTDAMMHAGNYIRTIDAKGLVLYHHGSPQLVQVASNHARNFRPINLLSAILSVVLNGLYAVNQNLAGRLLARCLASAPLARAFADYFMRDTQQGFRLFGAMVGVSHPGTALAEMTAAIARQEQPARLGQFSADQRKLFAQLQQLATTQQMPSNALIRRALKTAMADLAHSERRMAAASAAEIASLQQARLSYFSLLALPMTTFNAKKASQFEYRNDASSVLGQLQGSGLLRYPKLFLGVNALYVNQAQWSPLTETFLGQPALLYNVGDYSDALRTVPRGFSTSA